MKRQISIAPDATAGPARANSPGRFRTTRATKRVLVLSLVLSLHADSAFAQQTDDARPKEAATTQGANSKQSDPIVSDKAPAENGEKPAAMQSLIPELPDYSGDLSTRKFLLGDWGGTRQELAEKGILIDLELNQVFQGNAYGGKNTSGVTEYSGWALFIATIT